jgi:hypothetical protein
MWKKLKHWSLQWLVKFTLGLRNQAGFEGCTWELGNLSSSPWSPNPFN